MIQKNIYLPFDFECDKCGKHIKIDVPYVYNSTQLDGEGHYQDIYVKDRLEKNPDLCNCDGIFNKVEEEYKKMNSSYSINH